MQIDIAAAAAPARRLAAERVFFTAVAASMLAAVLVGFAPTYYLAPIAPDLPTLKPLNPYLAVHGALFSAWVLLFMVQVGLVAGGRRDLHRTLGGAGLILLLAMIPVGLATILHQVAIGSAPPRLDPLSWFALPLASLVGFSVLFLAAFAWRRTPGAHKRLMVLGMAAMMSAAFGRITAIPMAISILVLPNLYVAALAAWDVASARRLHPATLWGGLLVLVVTIAPVFVWRTPLWLAFADWVIGMVR